MSAFGPKRTLTDLLNVGPQANPRNLKAALRWILAVIGPLLQVSDASCVCANRGSCLCATAVCAGIATIFDWVGRSGWWLFCRGARDLRSHQQSRREAPSLLTGIYPRLALQSGRP